MQVTPTTNNIAEFTSNILIPLKSNVTSCILISINKIKPKKLIP